jgi:hypothetical protein
MNPRTPSINHHQGAKHQLCVPQMFTFGHVRQLDAVAARVTANLAAMTPLLPAVDQVAYVDIDDTVRQTYGYAKQGVGYGYTGVKGCHGRHHERRSKSTFAAVQLPRSWSAATTRAHAARQDPLDRYPGQSAQRPARHSRCYPPVSAGRGGNPCIGRGTARAAPAGSIRTDVQPSIHRPSMRYLMLMWPDADATSGNESDLQAWLDFDERVKANGAFVVNGALAPASTDARLVQTAIAGHALDRGGGPPTVRRRRPADSGLLHHGSPQHGRRPRVGEQVANLRLR